MTRKALSQFKTSTKVATADRVTARSTSSFTMAVAIAGQGGSVSRIFTISPSFSGKTTWDLSADGDLNLSSAANGTWTITPQTTFIANVVMWGGGVGAVYNQSGGGVPFDCNVDKFHPLPNVGIIP